MEDQIPSSIPPQNQAQLVATPQPSVVYIRRNLTVAELIVVFAIACGLVTGIQAIWNTGSRFLPSIEIRVK